MVILFWANLSIILYTYILFPGLVFLRGLLKHSPYVSREIDHFPTVSVIIAARNEAKVIGEKIKNLLSMNYPKDSYEVVIASDGSSDETDDIVKKFSNSGVKVLSLPRQGKAAALNSAFATSNGEIIVFSDANSIFDHEAIRSLVIPFGDSNVGGVAGNQCYLPENGKAISSSGEKAYWSFDRMLKKFQGRAGNTIAATGAIYAIRRKLFSQIPEGVTDDFFTSTGVIAQGYRLVFAQNAIAYEPVADSSEIEFGRKVRIMTRGLRSVVMRAQLLNPFRYGFYSLQLFSHKVLRRLVVFPLLLILLISPLLWNEGIIYQSALIAQLIIYSLGISGALLRKTSFGNTKIFTLPYFFIMVNTAAFVAAINLLRGHQIDRWEPNRSETVEA